MNHRFRLLSCVCVAMAAILEVQAISVWTGGANNGVWTDVGNWDPEVVPTQNTGDTAIFDDGSAVAATIEYPNSTAPIKINFSFLLGASSYYFKDPIIDNGGGGNITTASGMDNSQNFIKIKIGSCVASGRYRVPGTYL